MADFIVFDQGANEILDNGFPATTYFGLSDKSVDGTNPFTASVTLASGVSEITGTGYTRKSETTPTASGRALVFAAKIWTTGSATNWSSTVRSVFAATTSDSTGKLLCAWNLQAGGTARNLSAASTSETATPTFNGL